MDNRVKKIIGANMDIDFSNPNFGNSCCPWNTDENTNIHKCAVKDTSICKFFCGIQYLDSVFCSYPYENLTVLSRGDIDRNLNLKSKQSLHAKVHEENSITHKGTLTLETDRLILRKFVAEDLDQIYYNCWSNKDVWKWTSYQSMDCIEDVVNKEKLFTDKWLSAYKNSNTYNWAIQLKVSREVIGRFRGMHPNDRVSQVELAYEIGQAWWNHGYATEAAKRIIDFFFREVGINRIYAVHASENQASGRVMEKSGMRYEGTLRQALKCNNGLFDEVRYSILSHEYL